MRKTVCIIGVLLLLILSGCATTMDMDRAERWHVIKSPNTGRCYEVYKKEYLSQGFLAMAEIPCPKGER